MPTYNATAIVRNSTTDASMPSSGQTPGRPFICLPEEWRCSDLGRLTSMLEPLALQMRLEGWMLRNFGRNESGDEQFEAMRVGGQANIRANSLIELIIAIYDDCATRAPRKSLICHGCRSRHIGPTYGY